MKRFMQAMLAVALVLVTAFTFYIDTASAQPVSAPVPASCTSPEDCPAGVKQCKLPVGGSCVIAQAFQRGSITIINNGGTTASISLIYGGNTPRGITIPRVNYYPNNRYQSSINANGGAVIIENDSSVNCDISVILVAEQSAPVTVEESLKKSTERCYLNPSNACFTYGMAGTPIKATATDSEPFEGSKIKVTGICDGSITVPVMASQTFSCTPKKSGSIIFTSEGPSSAVLVIQ
ncbi:hypothetical protein [aff. Roholtiella sp. LEGE 12411]|uniref:hypothetical protein n=1 Tax=aff. Roholtiella sp. LEGE 12411 TaxID=1828822 RepID=UPI001881FE4E|nr:hypothetical protein [aff. Roholtiella sp. LEGE 12411]MBE9035844.1 hypothetical protein [aff. Roholtiella sp. LEGE 12411]